MQQQHQIVVDLTGSQYVDSTGLGTLLASQKRLRQRGGNLTLVISSPRIRKLFEITGMVKIFSIAKTLNEALAAFLKAESCRELPIQSISTQGPAISAGSSRSETSIS